MSEENIFPTEDLGLSGYLIMIGVPMKSHKKNGDRVCFYFDDSEETCSRHHIDYINSEFRKFDSVLRDLKKLVKRGNY
jgi:Uri superfamily endonuclease